jgi:hypothetical protein
MITHKRNRAKHTKSSVSKQAKAMIYPQRTVYKVFGYGSLDRGRPVYIQKFRDEFHGWFSSDVDGFGEGKDERGQELTDGLV